MVNRRVAAALLVALLSRPALVAADGDSIERLARLVEAGRSTEAFTLAVDLRPVHEGELRYDYLYGRAAIATGRLGEGILALERVLRHEPTFHRARLQLAIALYRRGHDHRAARAFRIVRAQNPPPDVTAAIDDYLAAIRRRADRYRTVVTGYGEFGFGHDSNVNSATEADTVSTGFGPPELALPPSAQSTEDTFARYGAGADISHPLTPDVNLVGGLDLAGRELEDEPAFETRKIDAWGGSEWRFAESRLRLTALAERFYVASDPYRDRYGFDLGWRRQTQGPWQVSLGLDFSTLRHEESTRRDSDITLLRGGLARGWSTAWRPILHIGAYAGSERAEEDTDDARAVAERDILGLRAGLRLRLTPAWRLRANLHYRSSEYAEAASLFAEARDEDLANVALALDWEPTTHWRLGPRLRYANNDANIALYDYERTVFELRARYTFF